MRAHDLARLRASIQDGFAGRLPSSTCWAWASTSSRFIASILTRIRSMACSIGLADMGACRCEVFTITQPAQRIKSHPTGGARGLLLALGLVNQMSGRARVDRKVIDSPACQGQGTGHKQLGRYLREPAPKPKETVPRERQRSELLSDASWQVHRLADGENRSGHGAKDFQESLGRAVPAPV